MAQRDYTVQVLRTYHVPNVGRDGNIHNITRVQIMVGTDGPFTQDFGPGQDFPDTPEGINQWKANMVAKLMAISGG